LNHQILTPIRSILFLTVLIILLGYQCACTQPESKSNRIVNKRITRADTRRLELPQDPNGNFTLYVSNQSFALPWVDIDVYIDGKLAIVGDFPLGDVFPQHCWIPHRFTLAPGKHIIRAVGANGKARVQKEFEIQGKHWAVLDFCLSDEPATGPAPNRPFFFFLQSDKPPMFM